MSAWSVLVVDDERSLRRLLVLLLGRDPRFEVVGEEGDGAAALAAIDQLDPDLVLLDLGLPVLDGLEVLQQLQQDEGRDRPTVVVLTGFTDPTTHERARALGAADCLVKGADLTRVPDRLAGAVERDTGSTPGATPNGAVS